MKRLIIFVILTLIVVIAINTIQTWNVLGVTTGSVWQNAADNMIKAF